MVTTRPPKTIVKPTALGPVANTDTKLLIYGLFQKGRVLAQDGTGLIYRSKMSLFSFVYSGVFAVTRGASTSRMNVCAVSPGRGSCNLALAT